jgi:hypothetical protein
LTANPAHSRPELTEASFAKASEGPSIGNSGSAGITAVSSVPIFVTRSPAAGQAGVLSVLLPAQAHRPGQPVSLLLPQELAASGLAVVVDPGRLPAWLVFDATRWEFRVDNAPPKAFPLSVEIRTGPVVWIMRIRGASE